MARSPLFSELQRIFNDLAGASDRGQSLEEYRAERAVEFSRRSFLRGAGATLGLAVAGAALPASIPRMARAMTAPRIAIIGGGIAGLTAALSLADAGLASTVYEAGSTVGGRMHSNTGDWQAGQVTEWCGELLNSGDTTIRGLITRFGLTLTDLKKAEPVGSSPTVFYDQVYVSYQEVSRDYLAVLKEIRLQIARTGFPVAYYNANSTAVSLDLESVYEWIDRVVPGGHSQLLGRILDTAFACEFGIDSADLSALNTNFLVGTQTGTTDERYIIAGGNQRLPQAIANALPAGAVQLKWRMTSISTGTGGITLGFSTPGGPQTLVVDHVILALPFTVLRGLDIAGAGFDALKMQAIRELGYGTNSKLALQFDTRYWNKRGPWGISNGVSMTDLSYQTTWDTTRGQAGTQGIILDYTGGAKGASFRPSQPYTSNGEALSYATAFLKELELVWPGISAHYLGRATLSCPWLDPNLLGSYSGYLVGQITAFCGYEGARQGNIHFAGEHCSILMQGYMEGAAAEGARAAGEIVTDIAHQAGARMGSLR